jgi:hypothetical protein
MRPVVLLMMAGLLGMAVPARAGQLAPAELANKNEGGYVTALPLFAYSTDLGYGIGARAYYYWDGHPDDPRFAGAPYVYRVFLQAFAATRGTQFHWLDFDAPRLFSSPYRLRSQLIYQRDTSANYFGRGEHALPPLTYPGSPRHYHDFDAYSRDQSQIVDGTTYARYDQYDLTRPVLLASVERLFAGDRVRVLAGAGASYARIHDYTGSQVDATGASGARHQARELQTRLAADCATGEVLGCSGGKDDYLRLGASYDTRDYEPDPNTGTFIDAALDLGTKALASRYNYVRAMVAARGYWSPIPDDADLVVAGRAMFEAQTNGAPFFSMDTLPFTDDPRAGLGGHRTLRGFRQDRFVGSVMTLGNAEVRWTWGHARVLGQRFGFIIAPFVDTGRPYDSLGGLSLRNWQTSYGGAFRIAWNLATVITIDYARSSEDTGFYVNFNHIF